MTTFINHLRPDSGSHSSTSVSPRKLPRDKAANMNTNSMETYYGLIKTPTDAIKLFEACRLGLNPRVQRRLSEKERQMIRSGSVFVWDEREAGMRRWTDGKSWSASRVSGSFLTYREMEGKRGGSGFNGGGRRGAGKTPDSCRGSDEDQDDGEPDGLGYRYKADGLMKQSFSISTSTGQHLHLISYYTRNQTDLPQPSTDPQLRHITPPKGMYPESSMNDAGPPSTRAPMPAHYSPHNPPYMHTAWQQPPYWPHSPVSTPPYQQGPYAGGPPPYHHEQPQLPPLQQPQYGHPQQQPYHPPHPQQHPAHAQYQQHPHAHYPPHHHSAYHQGPLPHPQNHLPPLQHPYSAPSPAPSTLQPSHPTLPPPRSPPGPPHESPRSQQLQAKAREAVGNIEPLLANKDSRSYHGSQGPLPPLTMPTQHQTNGNSVTSAQQIPSPPSRTMSLSPQSLSDLNRNQNGGTAPSSAVSASKQPSLSVLLQPDSTPAASEPTSAHSSTSATSSSPRSTINPAHSSMPILAPIKSLTTGIPGSIGAGITVSNGINGASGKSYEGVVKQWAP